MATTASSALCPVLATPAVIITKENVQSLQLSDYSRDPGTTVNITCLTSPDYRLVGPSVLTCLNNGQWNGVIPSCELDPSSAGGGVLIEDGEDADLRMLPVLVTVGILGVLLLGFIGVMLFVNFCWKHAGPCSKPGKSQKAPIGLFRSLDGAAETDSAYTHRRHRYYPASEASDVIDSVSTRCPPHTHAHSPEVLARDPFTYNNIRASSRNLRDPSMLSGYSPTENISRSPATTYYTARSKGPEPPFNTRVGTRQSYRTWHELFYTSDDRR